MMHDGYNDAADDYMGDPKYLIISIYACTHIELGSTSRIPFSPSIVDSIHYQKDYNYGISIQKLLWLIAKDESLNNIMRQFLKLSFNGYWREYYRIEVEKWPVNYIHIHVIDQSTNYIYFNQHINTFEIEHTLMKMKPSV